MDFKYTLKFQKSELDWNKFIIKEKWGGRCLVIIIY